MKWYREWMFPAGLVAAVVAVVVVVLAFHTPTREIQPTQPVGNYSGKLNTFRVKLPHRGYADCVEISTSRGVALWCQ